MLIKENGIKRRQEPLYRLKCNVSSVIRGSIKRKNFKKKSRTEEILGCSIEDFIEYLQSKFKEGMTIENHGEWHIDHIIPICVIENLKKGNKIL